MGNIFTLGFGPKDPTQYGAVDSTLTPTQTQTLKPRSWRNLRGLSRWLGVGRYFCDIFVPFLVPQKFRSHKFSFPVETVRNRSGLQASRADPLEK